MNFNLLFVFFISLFFISCSSNKILDVKMPDGKYKNIKKDTKDHKDKKPKKNKKNKKVTKYHSEYEYKNQNISSSMLKFFKEYKGVKYKYGGVNKKGLDCSAFVQNYFKQSLEINLPRTTYLQVKKGKTIKKSQLRAGDLVFFKRSRTSRHVGIYLKNGEFMHVSSSKGVIISKLSNVYWRKYYWKSTRVLN